MHFNLHSNLTFNRPFNLQVILRHCACVLFLAVLWSCTAQKNDFTDARPGTTPADLVDPLVDAANSRWFFFNSATRPFGMVNLSPDTEVDGTWGAGYRYHQDTIRCFSHIHAWQLSGIPVLPSTGKFKGHLGTDAYGSTFSHDNEVIRPGYHKVLLETYGITAELTATTRAGFHRYTFPETDTGYVHFDFTTTLGPSKTAYGYAHMISDKEIAGYAVMAGTVRRPKPVKVYYVAQFDQAFDAFRGWKDGKLINGSNTIAGNATGVYLTFFDVSRNVVKMKVGISYVSEANARQNLQTEIPGWNFDRVAAEAFDEWNRWLGRIEIEGGTRTQQRRFYTDLWHALQGRRIVNDVNGQYLDMTGDVPRTGQIPLDDHGRPRFNHHNSDSFWGAQWTINTLWHLVYPEVTESFVNSMLLMYDDGGLIPRGPSGGNYTHVMTGASSTPFIVSAWMKGIRHFDVEKAYAGMKKNHLPGGMMGKAGYEHNTAKGGGVEEYIRLGYVPHPLDSVRYGFHQDGAAQTLEYAYQDFALAQLAKALGKDDDYRTFMKRAGNYRNLWNEAAGWMWVKDREGNWREPVEPLAYSNGWVEGNAAQYTWFVPHDVAGLISLMGGRDAFTTKLNDAFTSASVHDFVSGKSHDVETMQHNREVYINYGNQPSIQTAFLFNYSGSPWLTQYWSRQIVDKVYSGISPEYGYSGDEDQGLMGSLAVLMKMGIFSTNGGTSMDPVYEIGSPLFDKVTIHLDPRYYSGEEIIIRAADNGPENVYVQAAQWNGAPLQKAWLSHADLVKGGTLALDMGATPNKAWGAAPEVAPPSMSTSSGDAVANGDAQVLPDEPATKPLSVRKGGLIYENSLATGQLVRDWVMEGPGVTEFKDGWMELYAPGEEWHHVYWCPRDFPSRFVAEWELQNMHPQAGLVIVFFATKGTSGEDIFDPSLPERDGTFKHYTKDKLNGYHISYYANNPKNPDREFAHLRKNNMFALVQTGAEGIPRHSTSVHHVTLVKDDGHIVFYVDDRKIIDWQDDGKTLGPVYGSGKIGFRQMQWSHFRYRNFKVWSIDDKKEEQHK